MCGGSLISTGDATSSTYEAKFELIQNFARKQNMLKRRYAHCCVHLNGYVYAIGGFDNRDVDGVPANTLDHCERFSIHDNKWIECSSMEEQRAFAGAASIKDQFIYVFGGFKDYEMLSSVEKYDSVTDSWTTIYVKLP